MSLLNRKTIYFVGLLFLWLFLSAYLPVATGRQQGDPRELIVGRWEDVTGSGYTVEFFDDGGYYEKKSSGNEYLGTYTISDDGRELTITGEDGFSTSGSFRVDEEGLILFGLTKLRRVGSVDEGNDTVIPSEDESLPTDESEETSPGGGRSFLLPLLIAVVLAGGFGAFVVAVSAIAALVWFLNRTPTPATPKTGPPPRQGILDTALTLLVITPWGRGVRYLNLARKWALEQLKEFLQDTSGGVPRVQKVSDILKSKKGSIKQAKLPKGSPSWDEFSQMTMQEIETGARANQPGFKVVRKLLTDKRFNK